MVFAYGKHTDNENLKEWIFDLLEKIPARAQQNHHSMGRMGVMPQSAYDTQALLEQRKNIATKELPEMLRWIPDIQRERRKID